jgi:hypothetical protein
MAKVLRCNEVVGNCDFVARGESDQDVLQQASEHARNRTSGERSNAGTGGQSQVCHPGRSRLRRHNSQGRAAPVRPSS